MYLKLELDLLKYILNIMNTLLYKYQHLIINSIINEHLKKC